MTEQPLRWGHCSTACHATHFQGSRQHLPSPSTPGGVGFGQGCTEKATEREGGIMRCIKKRIPSPLNCLSNGWLAGRNIWQR